MLDIINKQLKSGRAFAQSRHHGVIDRGQFPKFHWELYPLAQEYYHELNPCFLAGIYKKELLNFSDVYTVRDGSIGFTDYLVNNFDSVIKSKKHFIIPTDFAKFLPPNLHEQFSCWTLSQSKKIHISQAKRVIVFGLITEKYLGPLDDLRERIIEDCKGIGPNAAIDLVLCSRQDPFKAHHKESILHFELMDLIRSLLPNREFNYVKLEHFLEKSFSAEDYLLDLKHDSTIVSDSYLHYFFASKGVTVNLLPATIPSASKISLKLSFWHQLNIQPMPDKVNSIFTELLFYKKQNQKNLLHDSTFHRMLSDKK